MTVARAIRLSPDDYALPLRYGSAVADRERGRRRPGIPGSPRTLAELYERFEAVMSPAWRPATQVGNASRWKLLAATLPDTTAPDLLTLDLLDTVQKRLRSRDIAPNQIRQAFQLLRTVWRLASQRRWVTTADPLLYKCRFGRDEVEATPEEYRPEEWRRLVEATSPSDPKLWRLHVALLIAGTQGPRINSLRHLSWEDVDRKGRIINWPAKYMKQGRMYAQPMTDTAADALVVAWQWRERMGYRGRWVLPAPRWKGRDGPMSNGTLHLQLHDAQIRAGVDDKALRAWHGFRRMVAENVYLATGDMLAAAKWIGDEDVKVILRYLRRQDERLHKAAKAAEAAVTLSGVVLSH